MNIRIRHADKRDVQSIVCCVRATLQDMEAIGGHEVNSDEVFWEKYAEKIAEFIRKGDRLYLVYVTDSSVLGYLEGEILSLPEVFTHKKSFHISAVYVIPESRQRGIATSLVKEALRWASKQGCQDADLNVIVHNKKAKGLYQKFDFTIFQQKLVTKI